jgi:hypothetical protein
MRLLLLLAAAIALALVVANNARAAAFGAGLPDLGAAPDAVAWAPL